MNPPDAGARRLLAWLLLFCCVWIAVAMLWYRTPPIDNVEQMVWREAVEWGYYKHPPLPTWLLAAASAAWPASPLLTYVLGAGCMVVALLLFGGLLQRLLGRGDALLCVLAALCLTYATDRLVIFNHNVVMLPFIAGVFCLLWRTTERPSLTNRARIGLLLGLGMLAKYQMALIALCVGAWWLRIGGWRSATHGAGLALATALAALVFAPHLVWLVDTRWAPLAYANDSSLGAHLPLGARPLHALFWLTDWMGNRQAPAWAMVLAALLLARRERQPASPLPRLQRDFLWLAGFGPMLIMVALSLVGGIYLQPKWSTAFALWTVPAVLALLPSRWRLGDTALPPKAWWAWALIQVAVLVYTLHTVQVAARHPMGTGGWKQRDFAAMARTMQAQGAGQVDVVSGPYGVAGMLARQLPGAPRVLIDGDLARSPWLSAADLAGARVVSVWPTCHAPAEAHTLAPGWAWWPRPSPPPIDRHDGGFEDHLRRAAQHSGGTAVAVCP